MKKHCEICNKKINSAMPLLCKCNKYYCHLHKYPDHKCDFDYFKEQQKKLKDENQKILSSKLITNHQ